MENPVGDGSVKMAQPHYHNLLLVSVWAKYSAALIFLNSSNAYNIFIHDPEFFMLSYNTMLEVIQ